MLGACGSIGVLRAQDALSLTQRQLQTSLERLSTGVRVNRADDDASGLILRDRFGAQVLGLEEGIRNVQTASGLVQVAEEGLNKITDALQQMRQLAVRAADDNLNDDDRADIQVQVSALLKEINDRSEKTKYNGNRLLDGSIGASAGERHSSAKVQTNAILRNGSKLMEIGLENPAAAETFGAVSQGSYAVKLVYSDAQRSAATHNTKVEGTVSPMHHLNPVESTLTTLRGYVNESPGEPPASITQTVYDKAGVAHAATITFDNPHGADSNTWDYSISIAARGRWSSTPVSITGTGTFNDQGEFVDGSLTVGTSSGVASATVDAGNGRLKLVIDDGTLVHQNLDIDFTALRENHLTPVSVTPDLGVNGTPGAQTSAAACTGILDKDEAAGFSVTTEARNWVDRVGVDHSTSVTFQKLDTNTWQYTVNGLGASGVWTGVNSANTTGAIVFQDDGTINTINGTAPAVLSAVLGDGTAAGQAVAVDLTALTQVSNGTAGGSSVSATQNGAAFTPDPTQNANWSGVLRSDSAVGTVVNTSATWYDREGAGHNVTLALTKSVNNAGLDDQWSYAVTSGAAGAWSAGVGDAGTLVFDGAGSLSSPAPYSLNIADGTTAGHSVGMDFGGFASVEVTPLGGAPDGSSFSYTPTTAANWEASGGGNPVLDASVAAGAGSAFDFDTTWYDRVGAAHTVNVAFQKVADGADPGGLDDVWRVDITSPASGVWAWGVSNTNFLQFDSSGSLTSPLGATVTFADAAGHPCTIDLSFDAFENRLGASDVTGDPDGAPFVPDLTENANITGMLDSDAALGTVKSQNYTWYDWQGAGHGVTLELTKVVNNPGLDDIWTYDFTLPAGGVWTGRTDGGALFFDAGGNLTSPAPYNMFIPDGLTENYVAVDFSSLSSVSLPAGAAGAPDGSDFTASYRPTGNAGTVSHVLDADEAVGFTTGASEDWYDRLGNAHSVSFTFEKLDTNEWWYTIGGLAAGGAWNGANAGSTTGTLSFSDAGALTAINGAAPATFDILVGDDTSAEQQVTVDFTNLLQPTNGTLGGSTVQNPGTTSADGDNAGDPSTAAVAQAGTQLLSLGGAQDLDFSVVDRTGTSLVSGFRVRFTEVTPTSWSYQVLAPSASGFTGAVSGGGNGAGGGTILFEPDGDMIQADGGGTTITARFEDGTAEDQTVTIDLTAANVKMAKREDLTPTTTDGSAGQDLKAEVRQTVYDRDGNAHGALISLTESATPDVWNYSVRIDGGGAFEDEVTAGGSIRFQALTDVEDALDTGKMVKNSLSLTSTTGVLAGGALTFTDLDRGALTIAIQDGTASGQSYTIDFSALGENQQLDPADPPAGTRWAMGVDGSAGAQTKRVAVGGTLLMGQSAGNSTSTLSTGWVDRTGRSQSVGVTLTKVMDDDGASHGEIWKYSLTGVGQSGVWTGNNSKDSNIIIQFRQGSTQVQAVNGVAGSRITATLGDGTADGQKVELDFSGLSLGGANSASQTPDGAGGSSTTTASFIGTRAFLTTGQGPVSFRIAPVVDRTGAAAVSGGMIRFTQVGDSNTWSYAISAPSDSGFTGRMISGGSGSVTFQDDGDMIIDDPENPASFMVKLDDGTQEGQTVTFTLEDASGDGLKMVRDSDLRKTVSDGGAGRDDPQVDAVIYWSDGGSAPAIVSTLEGVSLKAKAYEAGGVILTVNTVTKEDIGVAAFAKTLTYVSATTSDNAMQFQVDADQGEVFRMGISSMTVDTLFRRDHYQGEDSSYDVAFGGSISVATSLQAQDLIGQIDEALAIVGESNVKVGAFKNEFDRTLDLQRAKHTQTANAYANINDADMAVEATSQSKRMILMQSSTAMIAQANTTSQYVLQLLR